MKYRKYKRYKDHNEDYEFEDNEYRNNTQERYVKNRSKENISDSRKNCEMTECLNCGWTLPSDWKGSLPEHCPNCLSGIHREMEEGYECGGILEPVGFWVKDDDKWEIIQRCRFCGEMRTTPMNGKDNRIKVLSIASRPLSMPPFPIERIKELRGIGGRDDETEGGE